MTLKSDQRLLEYYERQLGYVRNRIAAAEAGKPTRAVPAASVREKRMRVWRHNSFFGFCAMAQQNMRTIQASETATETSKEMAEQILGLLGQLHTSLKNRKELSK